MPALDNSLRAYYHRLSAENRRLNLMGEKQLDSYDYFYQQQLDSCLWLGQVIIKQLQPSLPFTFIDLGSGNGLPALPLSLFFAHHQLSSHAVMVEKVKKKAAAIDNIIAMFPDVSCETIAERLEDCLPSLIRHHHPLFITARALLPLPKLLPLLSPLLSSSTPLFLLKGKSHGAEWQAVANKTPWHHQLLEKNNQGGVVLKLTKII